MLLEHEGDHGLGMDAMVTIYALGTRTQLWLGAMVTVCCCNTNEIMYETTPHHPPHAHPRCKISSTTRPLTGAVSTNTHGNTIHVNV